MSNEGYINHQNQLVHSSANYLIRLENPEQPISQLKHYQTQCDKWNIIIDRLTNSLHRVIYNRGRRAIRLLGSYCNNINTNSFTWISSSFLILVIPVFEREYYYQWFPLIDFVDRVLAIYVHLCELHLIYQYN